MNIFWDSHYCPKGGVCEVYLLTLFIRVCALYECCNHYVSLFIT